MSTLTDFLKEHAQRLAQPEVQRQLAEWRQSVDVLMRQLEVWLHEADPQGVLKVTQTNLELREEKFGLYEVPRLTIDLGGRRVEITPRGGAVGGAVRLDSEQHFPIRGLVELTNEIEKYRLSRLLDENGERWVIKGGMSVFAQPLTQQRFEQAMLQLLS